MFLTYTDIDTHLVNTKNVIIPCLLVIYYIVFKHIFIKDTHETRTLKKWICADLPTAVLTFE